MSGRPERTTRIERARRGDHDAIGELYADLVAFNGPPGSGLLFDSERCLHAAEDFKERIPQPMNIQVA
jgi:hypothetical protein